MRGKRNIKVACSGGAVAPPHPNDNPKHKDSKQDQLFCRMILKVQFFWGILGHAFFCECRNGFSLVFNPIISTVQGEVTTIC